MRDITIKDIASQAGVSISTVSRVINGNYPVRQAVREKVEEVMRELEYHPKAVRTVPGTLAHQPIFLSIDDTMFEKYGKHFEMGNFKSCKLVYLIQ